MAVPLTTTITGPASQHLAKGSSFTYSLSTNASETGFPITGYQFFIGSANGDTVYDLVSYAAPTTGVSLSPGAGGAITWTTTLAQAIPQNTVLAVFGRIQNVSGWGAWSSTPFQSTSSKPVQAGVLLPANNSSFTSSSASYSTSFTATFTDANADSLVAYRLVVETAAGGILQDSGKVPFTVAAGTQFTIAGPSVPVTPGSTVYYRWKLRVWDAAAYVDADASDYIAYQYFSTSQYVSSTAGIPYIDTTYAGTAPIGDQTAASSQANFSPTFWFRPIDPEGLDMPYAQLQIINNDGSVYFDTGQLPHVMHSSYVDTWQPWSGSSPVSVVVGRTYTWRARVWDASGNQSAWVGPYSFTYIFGGTNQQPTVTPTYPISDQVVPTLNPTLQATFVDTGSVANKLNSYKIELIRVSDGTVLVPFTEYLATNQEIAYNQIQRFISDSILSTASLYKWRIQVRDNGGWWSGISPYQTFSVITSVPLAPTITSGSGTILSNTPTFSGTYNVGGGGGNVNFARVIVYSDASGSTTLWDSSWFSISSGGAGTPFSVIYGTGGVPTVEPALTNGQVIYWKAATKDVNGIEGPYTSMQQASIQSVPQAPINLKPTSSLAEPWPIAVAPAFSGDHYNPGGNAMNAASVEIYSTDGYIPIGLLWSSGIVTASGTRFRIPLTTTLVGGAPVYWRARTRDSVTGYWGTWSATQTLLFNSYPLTPTSLSPANGSAVLSVTPTLSWIANTGDTITRTTGAPDGQRVVFSKVDIIDNSTAASVTAFPKYTADVYDTFSTSLANITSTDSLRWPTTAWSVEGTGTFLTNVTLGRCTMSATPTHARAYKTGTADTFIGAVVKYDSTTNARHGLLLRRTDANNWWVVTLEGGTTPALVLKFTSNAGTAFTTVAQKTLAYSVNPLDIVSGYDQHLAVELNGSNISVYLNGELALSATNSTGSTATGHGLYSNGVSGGEWDDFYAAPLTAGANTYVVPGSTLAVDKNYNWNVSNHDGFVLGAVSQSTGFTTAQGPTVAITSPTAASVLTSGTPTVNWTYTAAGSGGIQESYRLRLFENGGVLYDTGIVSGTATTSAIPAGYLRSGHSYFITVSAADAFYHIWSSSAAIAFSVVYAPPSPVTGFLATPYDEDGYVALTWVTSAATASAFVRYELYRDIGAGPQLFQIITDQSTTTWTDYFAPRSELITYNILQVQLNGLDFIPSVAASSLATLHLRDSWITDTVDPTYRVRIRDNPSRSFSTKRDGEDVRYWGNQKPIRYFGNTKYQEFSVSGHLVGPDSANPALVTEDETDYLMLLREMISRKNVVCYRDGRGRQIFANFDMSESDVLPNQYQVSLTLVESEFTEGNV